MSNKYSDTIKAYLNENYADDYYSYNANYFMKRMEYTNPSSEDDDDKYYYVICQQSLSDNDIDKDTGIVTFLQFPTNLTKAQAKEIIGASPSCDDYGVVV